MTSQKRKSSLPENTTKRQKIKECESHSVTPKKRLGISSKAKTNLSSAQKKKNSKTPTNKAIKNSKPSKAEAGQKRSTVLKATKKSAVKIVPAKRKNLPKAKEVTPLKKVTQRSSSSASKAQKKNPSNVRKTVAKESTAQNKSNKITRSTSKNPALRVTKTVKCVKKSVATKTRPKSDLQPAGIKKTVKNVNHSTPSKPAKKCDMLPKCNKQVKKVINIKKTPVRKTAVKKSDVEPKTKAHKPAQAVKKATGTRKKGLKPSPPISLQTIIPVVSKKRLKDNAKQGSAKTAPKNSKGPREKIKISEAKSKTCSKQPKRTCPVNHTKNSVKSVSVPNSTVKKKIKVGNPSISCSSSSKQMLDSSLNKRISSEGKAILLPSAAPLKRKRITKPVDGTTKSKAKKQKVVQSETNKKKDTSSEEDQKSKRVSILDLCNEIAGEIESDTVEVVKGPSSPTSLTDEKTKDESAQILADVSPPVAEKSPVCQLNRFFPSRKPQNIRCKLEKKTSPGTRNSKWIKIKLKNSFAQNNLLRKRAVLPSLELMKAKISQGRQSAPCSPVSVNARKSDTSAMENKHTKPAVSQKVKDNNTQIAGSGDMLEKTSAENGFLENHIKQELEAALDEVIMWLFMTLLLDNIVK